jgi:putative transposase
VAAKKFFRRLRTGLRHVPRVIVTDKLASYQVAHRELMASVRHRRSKHLTNRAENSHQPTRHRQRAMKRFTSIRHAQRFLSAFSGISPHFRPRRHLLSAADYRQVMALHDLERDHRGDDHGRRLNRPLGHDVSTKPTAQQPESSHRPIGLAQVDNALPRVSYPSLLADRCHPMRRCAAGIALRRSEGAYSLAQQPHDPQQLAGISGLS